MRWRPTPAEDLITARRLVGDSWEACRFDELQPGDVFQAVGPDGGFVNPTTGEDDDACIARVADFPVRNELGQTGQAAGRGWGVPINLYPSMAVLQRKGLS